MGGERTSNKSGKPRPKKQPQKTPKSDKKAIERRGQATHDDRSKEVEIAKIDFTSSSMAISAELQQLLLNIFRFALFSTVLPLAGIKDAAADKNDENQEEEKDLHTQIQTMKTHLYNRDFGSAFADASPSLLRAYALRWSASRCLAYSGMFKGVLDYILNTNHVASPIGGGHEDRELATDEQNEEDLGVLCIGGGAGAEIVALAGAWRVNEDNILSRERDYMDGPNQLAVKEEEVKMENLSLTAHEKQSVRKEEATGKHKIKRKRKMAITAVDIAEWSDVIHRLDKAIHSAEVPGSKTCPSPLIHNDNDINISFRHLDILSLSETDLISLLAHSSSTSSPNPRRTHLISLMFTLNELFSTSISKTTQFLLRITDITSPGTILLVVDSPGSYSTLSFSKSDESSNKQEQQRQYPMKFLLDHTLLSVAVGKWEKIVSQDSRWFRRDANSKLYYNVDLEGGQGFIKLEDMRCQIHVYRRLSFSRTELGAG